MITLVAAVAGVTVALVVLAVEVVRLRRRVDAAPREGGVFSALADLDERSRRLEHHAGFLTPRLKRLEAVFPTAVQHTAVVAYDAFDEIAGRLSRSIALLDARGSGVVLSVLVGRDHTRWFAKAIDGWQGSEPLSPEEEQAIEAARPHR